MRRQQNEQSKTPLTPAERAAWNAYKREYYKRNRQKIIEQNARWSRNNREKRAEFQREYVRLQRASDPLWETKRALRRRYGLTYEQFEAMRLAQDGRCAICRCVPSTFHVDHNHRTGVVRGLLCLKCNVGIGLHDDNVDVLARMIAYLTA